MSIILLNCELSMSKYLTQLLLTWTFQRRALATDVLCSSAEVKNKSSSSTVRNAHDKIIMTSDPRIRLNNFFCRNDINHRQTMRS